jgi:hypothetical protein
MNELFSAERWLERAAALRMEAASLKSPEARAELLKIAAAHELLARHAAKQISLPHGDIAVVPISFPTDDRQEE